MQKNVFISIAKKKFKASSLVEVIVAFVICLIIFTISMRFILNVEITTNIKSRHEALILAGNIKNYVNSGNVPDDDEFVRPENLQWSVDTIRVPEYDDIHLVFVVIRHEYGQLLFESNHLSRK